MLSDADILARAHAVVTETLIGVLTTVDPDGRPHARPMVAIPGDETLNRLYSLTAHETRKIEQVGKNRRVCWTFHRPQFHEVVTLLGTARTAATADLSLSLWNRLTAPVEPYVPADLRDQGHYAFDALITTMERLEYLNPAEGLVTPRVVRVD